MALLPDHASIAQSASQISDQYRQDGSHGHDGSVLKTAKSKLRLVVREACSKDSHSGRSWDEACEAVQRDPQALGEALQRTFFAPCRKDDDDGGDHEGLFSSESREKVWEKRHLISMAQAEEDGRGLGAAVGLEREEDGGGKVQAMK